MINTLLGKAHWTATGGHDSRLRFAADWQTDTMRHVTAKLRLDNETQFSRSESSDGNNGVYVVTGTRLLDPLRAVYLIGGRRLLRSRVPGSWQAVWWRQFETKPGSRI